MADEIVIGKIGLTPKGEYVSGELYDILDMVSHEGNSYVSKIQNNNVDVTNTDAWMVSAKKGEDGEKGDTGDTFTFDDLTTEQKEELKGDVIAYNSLDEADKDDLASRVPITGVVEEGNTEAVSGGEVFDTILSNVESNNISYEILNDTAISISELLPTGILFSLNNATTVLYELETNTDYYIKNDIGTASDRYRLSFFVSKPSISVTPADDFYNYDNQVYGYKKINSGSNKWLAIYISQQKLEDPNILVSKFQFPSKDFLKKKIKEDILVLDDTVIIDSSFYKLIKNESYFYNSFNLGAIDVNGLDWEGRSEFYDRLKTGFIKSDGIKRIYLEKEESVFHIFLYDENKNFISRIINLKEYNLNTTGFFRLVLRKNDSSNVLPIDFFNSLSFSLSDNNNSLKPIYGNVTDIYNCPEQPNMNSSSGNFINSKDLSYFYNIMDSLVNDFPDIVSKSILGYASKVDGTADMTLPMNNYIIQTPVANSSELTKRKKFLIVAGLHGNEKTSLYGVVKAFDIMLRNGYDNQTLLTLLSNIEFNILFCNPYGVENHTRGNARDVDLNRNFSYNWSASTGKKGSEPYSELETKTIKDWLDNNENSDALIDYHNTSTDYYSSYVVAMNSNLINSYIDLGEILTRKWNLKYNTTPVNNFKNLVYNEPLLIQDAYRVNGIALSSNPEVAWDLGGSVGGSIAMTTSVELFVNFLMINFRQLI